MALLMALAVLVLMAILAVSFYSSQSLEREGADNARYARSAEAIAESGLNWAMELLARDRDDAANGLALAYDTNYDIWGPRARDSGRGYANNDDLLLSGNPNEVDLSPLFGTGSGAQSYDARWIPIHDGNRLIGRFAVIVEDECGKVNVNVAGSTNYILMDGLSPAEFLFNVCLNKINSSLGDTEAAQIIDLRHGPDNKPGAAGVDDDNDGPLGFPYCDDDLDGTVDEDGDGLDEPDEYDPLSIKGDDLVFSDLSTILLADAIRAYRGDGTDPAKLEKYNKLLAYLTVNSHTQAVYPVEPDNDYTEWRTKLSLNEATVQQIFDELDVLRQADRLPVAKDADGDALLAQIAANIADQIDEDSEPTALGGKHGLEKTAYLNEVETSPELYNYMSYQIHDHGEFIELINPYDTELTVTVHIHQQGHNGEYLPVSFDVKVPARTGDQIGQEGYYVIGDTSGWYNYTDPDTGAVTTYYLANISERPLGKCQEYRNLHLDGSKTITITTTDGSTIEVTDSSIDSGEGPATAQKDDPRLPIWTEAGDGNTGGRNSVCKPGDSGDKDANGLLPDLFAIYDGKLGAVGLLGRVHIGQPWATINLTGDDLSGTWESAHTQATWLSVYDAFTAARNGADRVGLINVNTAPEEVLSGLEDTANSRGIDANALYNATHPSSGMMGRVIESIGELGEFLPMSTGATTWEREKVLSDIAGLVTVRSNMFRVTVRAQALGRQGEVDKRGERWLQASVQRIINPTTGAAQIRIKSMRWLTAE
ncbi:MAG: hypothetical protein JW889_02195 [Verrucomicrobia bacterium]|nr:hypothetical protein [Verrucomicrobiota bacterium]